MWCPERRGQVGVWAENWAFPPETPSRGKEQTPAAVFLLNSGFSTLSLCHSSVETGSDSSRGPWQDNSVAGWVTAEVEAGSHKHP